MPRIRIAALAAVAAAALTGPAAASAATPSPILVSSSLAKGDFETTLTQIQRQRTTLLDQQLKDQAAAVKQRNAKIAALNAELSRLRGADPVANAAKIEMLEAEIDTLSSQTHMDVLKLQSVTNKLNEANDLMSNLLKKTSDTHTSIIANFR